MKETGVYRALVNLLAFASVLIASLGFFLVMSAGSGHLSYAQEIENDNDPHATGLILPTPKEIEAFKKTHGKVEKVLPNKIALERVNKERAKKGLPPLPEHGIAPMGKEVISSMGGGAPGPIATQELSSYVDNSALPAFPEIRSQGSLSSCASFAITYYHLTHTAGLMYEWDNNNADNTYKFSPRWSYNIVNRGLNSGSSFFENYDVLEEHGSATWAEFPYDGVDYKQWCIDPQIWQNAISYRINPVVYIDVDENNPSGPNGGLDKIKGILANGYVVTFGTYINSWQYTKISDDKTTGEDNAFVRKQIAYWVNGDLGGHAMTIVGYNDVIWTDINGNRIVEPEEKGALRIANSWGTGWKESGFTWLAYDALRKESAVPNGPSGGRVGAVVTGMVFDISLKGKDYTPKMVAEFNVHHTKRNQLRISLGISAPGETLPEITWYPGAISLQGGPYDFNGETTVSGCNGTFVFDFTDILPATTELKRYYLGIYDSAGGDPATLYSFRIIDGGIPQPASYIPPAVDDNDQTYAYLDYRFVSDITNKPPIAKASASPSSGTVPLTVNFSDGGSFDPDPDGTIVSYFWNFGDRIGPPGDSSGASGLEATHIYNNPGVFSAKLTVTDNLGATSSNVVSIFANLDTSKTMHIYDITTSLKTAGRNIYAVAQVAVVDGADSLVTGATVTGHWSGLTDDSDSGTTDSNGRVSLSSDKVSKSINGTFTFTVDNVVLSGWYYDPASNVVDSGSIPTP